MKQRITDYILKSAIFLKIVEVLKRIKFKRYEGLTLYEVIVVFKEKITKDDIIDRANGVAFNFTLSVFPAIIFLFTLTPYIHQVVPEISKASILEFMGEVMPQSMYETVRSTVEDIVGNTRGGLLTFGALFSLYLATNGMMSLMKAFNACYKTTERRSFIKTRLVGTALTFMLALALMLASILLVAGNVAIQFVTDLEWLDIQVYQFYILYFVRFLVLFVVFFLAISFIYYFGPAVHYN
ncbi:MAG: YihY/virulence factor BrkB family protein, partial [Fulvivirga sp.]